MPMLACPKHFVGYGAVSGGMDYNFVEMSEVTLREIHLPPFPPMRSRKAR